MIRVRAAGMAGAALSLAIFTAPGHTQSFPTKTVRIISPFAPGGGNDTISRAIAQKLVDQLGQTVIVENRPGANTIIGTQFVAKSAPDGYTLILVSNSHVINQSLYAKLPYDAVRDFSPITLVGTGPLLLVVHPSLPVKSVPDLIRLAHSKPAELTFSTAGSGSSAHLAGVLLASMAGIKLQHIAYKGSSPAVTALLSGEVTMSIAPSLTFLPHARARRVRVLATTGVQRSPAAPDIPTVAESGLPGYAVNQWYGLIAPAHVPKDIVQRLNTAVATVLKQPDVRERLSNQGVDPDSSTPEEFARLIAADVERWAEVVKEAGLKAD